jgi:hypothetical protein
MRLSAARRLFRNVYRPNQRDRGRRARKPQLAFTGASPQNRAIIGQSIV